MRAAVPLLLLTGLALSLPASATRKLGSLSFEPCNLSTGIMPQGTDAQCTTLEVPENRAEPQGRKIKLAIAWVPSEQARGEADPVFMIAGGPGQSARESYPGVSAAFHEVLARRDVILVDQRGTGESNPLTCLDEEGKSRFADEDSRSGEPEAVAAFVRACLAKLDADPRFYTTSEAVRDLDAVRAALGAEQINVVGISYGTRVAQEYLRRYPEHTRAVVLDGVVPPSLGLGNEHGRNLDAALDLEFARCAKDATCAERFPAPRQTLDQLLAQLRDKPVPVSFRDPLTAKPRTEDFTAGHLATVARMFSYDPRIAAMLPMALAEAANGRFDTLMMQANLIGDMVETTMAAGMQLSVVCAEDEPLLAADPAEARSTLGATMIEVMKKQCEVWPRGEMPEDFHRPVVSDTPVLLLSGEFDPVTPPRYGDEVAKTLANGRHLVLRGRGHNVFGLGCMPRLMATFLREPDKKLDASCLDELDYIPPFTGYYGWEP